VKAVFGLSKQEPGKYVVTVSHEDDDWYEVFGTNSYIKTSSCLSLALGEEAYLTISPSVPEGCGLRMATTAWSKASTPSCGYEMEMRSRGCC
jgi:hypothetical protein